jgi:hypothetical protein
MSSTHEQHIQELVTLQREFMDHIHKNGFDYGEYSAPPPGSYYETYRKRTQEVRDKIAASKKKH